MAREQTHRPRQANLDLAILRKALSLAVGDGLIKENVAIRNSAASGAPARPRSDR